MQYLISFFEGIITFVSPCLLPMLPVYVSYFAGKSEAKGSGLKNALAFVLGFTVVFTVLGAFAGTLGALLVRYQMVVNIVSGLVVIFFGLQFLGVFKLNLFKGGHSADTEKRGLLPSFVFGLVFSVSWTPCVGPFLGSALMLATQQGSTLAGILMLLCYSAGLGLPFIVSALLLQQLKAAFDFIKRHYKVINTVSGCLLIVVGITMMTGWFGRLLSLLAF